MITSPTLPQFDVSDPECPFDEEYLAAEEACGLRNTCVRAEHEDDDGYDPYSDRTVYQPLFERDPWD